MLARFVSLFLLVLAALPAAAAPLSFDPTFGTGGKVFARVSSSPSDDDARAVVVQPDGKTVVAGTCHTGSAYEFCVARYLANGTVDLQFGLRGVVTTSFGGGDATARAVALDGTNIVVAGSCGAGPNTDFCIARYLADGSLDTSFNGSGKVVTAMGLGTDDAWAVAMDGSGVLVAGECAADGGTKLCLARYLTGGTLDLAYGTGGKVLVGFKLSGAPWDYARAILVSEGKALVAGGCTTFTFPNFCVARFNANGTLDGGFGTAGLATSEMGSGQWTQANAIALSGSRILLAGGCQNTGINHDFCMLRVNASNGSIDTTLAGTGYVRFPVGSGEDVVTGVALVGSTTLLSGHCVSGGLRRFCLTALSEAGGITGGFNGGASLIDTFGAANNYAYGLHVAGSVVTLAGTCGPAAARDFCVTRYSFDTRDTTFNVNGLRVHDLAQMPGLDYLTSLVRQPDGKLLAAVMCITNATGLCMARFNSDGSFDQTFGDAGTVVEALPPGNGQYPRAILDAQNRVILAGSCNDGYNLCVLRYQADGTRDLTFGTGGLATVAMPVDTYVGRAAGISIAADGGLVIGAACYLPLGFSDFCWFKVTASGSVDAAFGSGGRTFAGLTPSAGATAALADASGFVIAGRCISGSSSMKFCAARVTPAGVLDTTFGAGSGRVAIPLGTGYAEPSAMVLQGGQLLLGGYCNVNGSQEFCLARLLADGSMDGAFSGDGQASTPVGAFRDDALALLPDGTGTLAAGACTNDAGGLTSDICLARFLADGSVDTSFDDGGTYVSSLGAASSRVVALVRSGNRIIAGAECDDPYPGRLGLCLAAFTLLANDVPRAPSVTGVVAGDAQAQVSFTPPADDGGSAITQYTATCGARSASGPGSPLTVTLLQNGVAVDCTVRAANANGTGPASDPPVSVTPRKAVTVAVAVSANPASAGVNLTLSVTVVGEAPTGVVQFYVGPTHFATCDRSLLLSGSASCITDQIPAGAWEITARYPGNAFNQPGVSPPIVLTVLAGGVNLTVSKSGQGTVTSNPGGIACGATCAASFAAGTPVSLAIAPAPGYLFSSATGCDSLVGSTCTVTMSAARSVHVSFYAPPVTLIAAAVGPGSIASAPAGIACGATCQADFPHGTVLTLTPTPAAGAMFVGWSGACWGLGDCQLPMDESKTVTAIFATAAAGVLSVTQSGVPAVAAPGRDVVYVIDVHNAGSGPAVVELLDYTPRGTGFVWASPGCTHAAGLVTCSFGSVPAGQAVQAKVVVRPVAAGFIRNDVVVREQAGASASLTLAVGTAPAATPVARYRLYSPVTLEHHFTTDLNEYNVLGTYVGTWVQEGTVGKVLNNPGTFNGVEAVPYYRLYDSATRWHHWTTDPNEYYTLGLYPNWTGEGADGFILPGPTAGATQLFRLTYPHVPGLHHWTIDTNEYTALIGSFGWIGEGGSGFVIQ